MWRLVFDIWCFDKFVLDVLCVEKLIEEIIGEYFEREGYLIKFKDDYFIFIMVSFWNISLEKCVFDFFVVIFICFM